MHIVLFMHVAFENLSYFDSCLACSSHVIQDYYALVKIDIFGSRVEPKIAENVAIDQVWVFR